MVDGKQEVAKWYVLFENATFQMMLCLDFKNFENKIIEFW